MARGDPPISLEALVPYYSGAYNVTVALKGRFGKQGAEGRAALQEVSRYQKMLIEYRDAIRQTREMKREAH